MDHSLSFGAHKNRVYSKRAASVPAVPAWLATTADSRTVRAGISKRCAAQLRSTIGGISD